MTLLEAVKPTTAFQTTFRCKRCGSPLIFIEDGDNVWLGCDRCAQYVRMNKKEARRYWNYRSRVVLWRDMLLDLYEAFEASTGGD